MFNIQVRYYSKIIKIWIAKMGLTLSRKNINLVKYLQHPNTSSYTVILASWTETKYFIPVNISHQKITSFEEILEDFIRFF